MDTTLNLIDNLQIYLLILTGIISIIIILILILFAKANDLKEFFNNDTRIKRESIINLNELLNKAQEDIVERINTANSNFENIYKRLEQVEAKVNNSLATTTSSTNIEDDESIHVAKIDKMNKIYQHLINDKFVITNSLFAVNEMVNILNQLISDDNEEDWEITKKKIEVILLFVVEKQLLKGILDPATILQNSGKESESLENQ